MKLTTTEEYGLRCLVQVARQAPHGSDRLTSIRDVADAEGLSADYVAKLLGMLRKAGLVESTRGAAGGYALARDPAEISAGEAMAAFDTPFYGEGFCTSHRGKLDCCIHKAQPSCALTSLWREVSVALDDVLGRVTLADLLSEPEGATPSHVDPRDAPALRRAVGGSHG